MNIANNNRDIKIGDNVKIIGHKFPDLHPPKPVEKQVLWGKSIYKYKVMGLDYIGMEGEIVEIRTIPETEYEITTGEIARYVIRLSTQRAGWKERTVTLYPEQIIKIK